MCLNKLTNHSQLKYEKCKKNTFIASRLNWFFELSKIEMSIHFQLVKRNAVNNYHQGVF